MANNQLQVALQGASEQLQRYKPKLAAALPAHIKPEKFERVVMTVLNQTPDLLNCDRLSLFTACTKCAQDGLVPDGREAALVPFKGQVQYMPMVYGLIKRTRQSGELASLSAHVVYENDTFDYALGDDEHIDHKPTMQPDRGQIIAAYAIAKLKDGTVQREVMTVAEIEEVRNVSRAKNAGPWTQWFGEMARKTVVRRLCKYLPLSAELMRTMKRGDLFMPMGESEPDDDLADAVRDITPETPRPKPQDYAENGTEAAEADEAGKAKGDRFYRQTEEEFQKEISEPSTDPSNGMADLLDETPNRWAIDPNERVIDGLERILKEADTPADAAAIQEANTARIAKESASNKRVAETMIKTRAQELSS